MMRVTRKDVIEQVSAFVQRRYGGDWKAAFDAEDEDRDGRLSVEEVTAILAKSGVGYRLNRWAVALAIVKAMDSDSDGQVSFEEFQSMTKV